MIELTGPMAIAALALAVGGIMKLRDPKPTVQMLVNLGLPLPESSAGRSVARLVGAVEVVIGSIVVLLGGPTTYVLAGLYAAFALVMARLVAMGPAAPSCGCFGSLSTRPTPVHVVADAVASGVALAAAISGAPGMVGAWEELGAGSGAILATLVALGTWALVAIMTVLPEALDSAGRGGPPSGPAFRLLEVRSTRRSPGRS